MSQIKKYFYSISISLSLLALVLSSLMLYLSCMQSKPTTGLETLLQAAKTHRFTEARLSKVVGYGELQRPSPESDKSSYINKDPFLLAKNNSRGDSNSNNELLSEATLAVYSELGKNPTPDKLHTLALLNILKGRYTEAIDNLENILNKERKSSQILNDLAVAYSERGDVQKRPEDLMHALSLIDEAIALDNSLLEAKFNRALLLEKVYLTSQAQQYWQEYLALELDSNWQKEAYKHINNLEKLSKGNSWSDAQKQLVSAIEAEDIEKAKPIVKEFPHSSRIYFLEELIPQWATLVQDGKEQEATKLTKIGQVIGEILTNLQQDKGVIDAIQAIIKTSNDPKQQTLLASAHLTYDAGKKALDKYENDKAKDLFEKAIALFSQAKDESSKTWAIFQIARCEMNSLNYQDAITHLTKVAKFAQERKNLYLLARSWWVIGLIQDYQSEFSNSLTSKRLALSYLEKAEDNEGVAVVNSLIAQTLTNLKNLEEVSSYQYKALSNSRKTSNSKWLFIITQVTSHQLLNLGEVRAASYFYKELNFLAEKEGNQTYKFSSLLESSQLYQKLSNNTLANSYLNAARQQLERIPDQSFRLSSEQRLLIIEAQYKVENDPQSVISTLNKLDKILSKDDPLYKTTLLRLQGQAYLALKQYDKAEEALKTSIEVFESQRSKITDERYRLSFFEEPQAVYEDMVKFQINQQQRLDTAFDYAELARSRSLLDEIDGRAKAVKLDTHQELQIEGTTKPFKLEEIQKDLPLGVTLVRYLVVSDRVYTWLVTKDKVEFIQHEIPEAELERQIARLRSVITDIKSEPASIQAAVNPVYQAIFAPLKPYLKQQTGTQPNLVIIPDKALYAVPFAALIDPEIKHYLIEDYTLATAPSATVYLRCLKRDSQMAKQDKEKVLAIGDPNFIRAHFHNMSYLSGAKEEAQIVAKLYPSSTLLLEKEATKKTFLKEATKYDVIHYAGHALIEPSSPLFSKLLLAAPEGVLDNYDEALYVHEIYGSKFDRTRLVVLAACQTAGGLRTHGEGMLSLARPFLASGIPSVIASIWDANDNASVRLFEEFHRQRLAGYDTASAMRLAQLNLLKDHYELYSHPRMWSLFQVIGGSVPKQPK